MATNIMFVTLDFSWNFSYKILSISCDFYNPGRSIDENKTTKMNEMAS